MTATTGNPHTCTPAGQGRTRHVLLGNDQGQLTLGRLRPWHRALARCAAAGLDRELAGASPETSTTLAARATQLTSTRFRRDLAISVQRILAATGEPPAVIPSQAAAGPPPRLPLRRAPIRQAAWPLAQLAGSLAAPGPVPGAGRGDDQPAARRVPRHGVSDRHRDGQQGTQPHRSALSQSRKSRGQMIASVLATHFQGARSRDRADLLAHATRLASASRAAARPASRAVSSWSNSSSPTPSGRGLITRSACRRAASAVF